MQYTPPRTEDSIGPSAAAYHTMDAPPYMRDSKAGQPFKQLNPKFTFLATGIILLSALCIVPIWNSFALMNDDNYVFWAGRYTPAMMLGLTVGLVLLYTITVSLFFVQTRGHAQSEQTIMLIANIFITVLGILLLLLSMPLTRQSVETYTHLMHECDLSPQTYRLFEYSQVLQNIRATPGCAEKYSVEECHGYEDAAPYTSFLKFMERSYNCAGFCYHKDVSLQAVAYQPFGPSPGVSFCAGDFLASTKVESMLECRDLCSKDERCNFFSFWSAGKNPWCHTTSSCDSFQKDQNQVVWIYSRKEPEQPGQGYGFAQEEASQSSHAPRRHAAPSRQHTDHVVRLSLAEEESSPHARLANTGPLMMYGYPPTLFSDANYQASCEGMAARQMKNFAGDIGSQTFYQGVYLVVIAIATGFLKLIGFCIRKDGLEREPRP